VPPVIAIDAMGGDRAPGEIVALLGPNGAGKTTTLLTTSALNPVMKGDVKVFGNSVKGRRPHLVARDGLAHVLEDRSLFFQLTVHENLQLGAHAGAADIDRALRYFPALADIQSRRAGLLSGGQQQMLAMARALASTPRLLMVDEMSLGLAPIVVQGLIEVLEQLKSEGLTMIIVEQSLNVAAAIADRAVFMEKGQVRFEGAIAELVERDDLVRAVFLGGEAPA